MKSLTPFLVCTLAWSTTVGATDLLSTYDLALQADPTILAASKARLAGQEKGVQGTSRLLPQVKFTASYTRVRDDMETTLPPALSGVIPSESSGNVHSYTTQLVQPIYDAGAFADYKQLHKQTEQAEIEYRHASQDLIERVAQTYFNVLQAEETVTVVDAQKAAVKEQLDRAEARFEAGLNKITEVQEVRARYDAVLADEISARNTLDIRRSQYRELTGHPAGSLAMLRSDFQPLPPDPDNLESWESRAMEGNSSVLIRRNQTDISRAEINRYRLTGRPTLELVASYGQKGQNGGLSQLAVPDSDRSRSVGIQLNVPLFTSGWMNSRLRESIAKNEQAEQELSAAQRDARLQVQDAYLSVKSGAARVNALARSLLSAQTSLEATVLGRDVGTRTTLDVLEAQQRLYSTQLDLAHARYSYLLGRVRLAASTGSLQQNDLAQLNAFLTGS